MFAVQTSVKRTGNGWKHNSCSTKTQLLAPMPYMYIFELEVSFSLKYGLRVFEGEDLHSILY